MLPRSTFMLHKLYLGVGDPLLCSSLTLIHDIAVETGEPLNID